MKGQSGHRQLLVPGRNPLANINYPTGPGVSFTYNEVKQKATMTTAVAGQQFEYNHDAIGNRAGADGAKTGGDVNGSNLRSHSYTANFLNQYSSRSVPRYVQSLGTASSTAAVWLWTDGGLNTAASRKQDYFRGELSLNNDNALYLAVTNIAVLNTGGSDMWRTITDLHTSTVLSENRFLYDGWNLVAELTATGNGVVRSYVWGLDLSGSLQGAGGVGGLLKLTHYGATTDSAFVAYDGNGNVAALFNAATDQVLATYEYGPFGEVIRATGPMAKANPFRFSTKYQDDETDMVYYGYRHYNASTGRWLSRDPIGERGGRNLYAFLNNSALNAVDALGQQGFTGASQCKCSCGPDVTRALGLAFADIRRVYEDADMLTQNKACRKLSDLVAGFDSWDINGLKYLSWPKDKDLNRLFCPECSTAVTYKGKCVNKDVLNWVFLGYAAMLCEFDSRELAGLKVKVRGGFVARSFPKGDPYGAEKLSAIDEGYSSLGGPNRFAGEVNCLPNNISVGIGTGMGKMDPTNWRWEGLNF